MDLSKSTIFVFLHHVLFLQYFSELGEAACSILEYTDIKVSHSRCYTRMSETYGIFRTRFLPVKARNWNWKPLN